jgi:hypothetical protein
MYLHETDAVPAAPKYRSRPQKPLLLLQDFLRRDRQVMEVCFSRYEYKDAASCRATFAKAIKYRHLEGQVAARLSGDKVYLIRLDPLQEEAEP